MGLYDESWCVDCGKSQPYSPDDVVCGNCTADAYESRSTKLIEYMKLHLISLEQDSEELQSYFNSVEDFETDEYRQKEIEDISINGQIIATRHLMSVASDILGIELKEK
mgnify:CR=1 FL=1